MCLVSFTLHRDMMFRLGIGTGKMLPLHVVLVVISNKRRSIGDRCKTYFQTVKFASLSKCEFHAEDSWKYCERVKRVRERAMSIFVTLSHSYLSLPPTHPPTYQLPSPMRESQMFAFPHCGSPCELSLHHLNKMLTLVSLNIRQYVAKWCIIRYWFQYPYPYDGCLSLPLFTSSQQNVDTCIPEYFCAKDIDIGKGIIIDEGIL